MMLKDFTAQNVKAASRRAVQQPALMEFVQESRRHQGIKDVTESQTGDILIGETTQLWFCSECNVFLPNSNDKGHL